MNEGFPNITEPAISANEGWQQMHSLLNEYLPVKKEMRRKKLLCRCAYVSIILSALLFSGLQLDNNIFHVSFNSAYRSSTRVKTTQASPLTFNKNSNRAAAAKNLGSNFRSLKNNITALSLNGENILQTNTGSGDESFIQINGATQNIAKNIFQKQTGSIIHMPLAIIPENVISGPAGKAGNKTITNRQWNFFCGAGINTAINGSQHPHPYPAVEARYTINPRIYIAGGLSAWSPVSTKVSGISKTFYATDIMNNISLNEETTTYSHLNYIDLPLSLGIQLNKNISVQGGLQMSLLISKRTEKILSVTGPSVTVPLSAVQLAMEHPYGVQVQNTDYRFVTGIRYSLKQTMIGLTYQHGLQPAGSGFYINKNHNYLVALNVLFQLK